MNLERSILVGFLAARKQIDLQRCQTNGIGIYKRSFPARLDRFSTFSRRLVLEEEHSLGSIQVADVDAASLDARAC